jgi:hypothetical protein
MLCKPLRRPKIGYLCQCHARYTCQVELAAEQVHIKKRPRQFFVGICASSSLFLSLLHATLRTDPNKMVTRTKFGLSWAAMMDRGA